MTHTGQGWLALGPALACLVYVPHMAAVLLLIVCRRRAFATWRKPLGSLATLHTALNVRVLGALRLLAAAPHGCSKWHLPSSLLLPPARETLQPTGSLPSHASPLCSHAHRQSGL